MCWLFLCTKTGLELVSYCECGRHCISACMYSGSILVILLLIISTQNFDLDTQLCALEQKNLQWSFGPTSTIGHTWPGAICYSPFSPSYAVPSYSYAVPSYPSALEALHCFSPDDYAPSPPSTSKA